MVDYFSYLAYMKVLIIFLFETEIQTKLRTKCEQNQMRNATTIVLA